MNFNFKISPNKLTTFILILLHIAPLFLGAQNFQIQNQFGFGSNDWDEGVTLVETTDGGFIYCSLSNGGASADKTTSNFGDVDIWVVKTDVNGIIQWQKSYGGVFNEDPESIIQTQDGNYLLTGWSSSGMSGNKTTPSYGWMDVWLLKIDPYGNIIWQKTYGGSAPDYPTNTIETANGNLTIVCTTESQMSGNKQLPLKGLRDFWVLFLDSDGDYIKELEFGGDSYNGLTDLSYLSNNTLLLSGMSYSSQSIDKSEPSYGEWDYWFIKCDTSGNIIKDKTIGGSDRDLVWAHVINNENNIIVFGTSNSPISGNKTAPNIGGTDLWLVKLDTNLNIIWDKTFGGTNDEEIAVGKAYYSDYLNMSIVSSSSKSVANGNKTSYNYGNFDYWIVGVDNQGNKVMEISIGGLQEDKARELIETSNHELMVIGRSESNVSGNKTVATNGGHDVWVVKLDITLSINEIRNENIKAFPIPASTILNFSVPVKSNQVTAEIVNINGQTVLTKTCNNVDNDQFDVTHLISGTYFLKISGPNFSYSRMVIIE